MKSGAAPRGHPSHGRLRRYLGSKNMSGKLCALGENRQSGAPTFVGRACPHQAPNSGNRASAKSGAMRIIVFSGRGTEHSAHFRDSCGAFAQSFPRQSRRQQVGAGLCGGSRSSKVGTLRAEPAVRRADVRLKSVPSPSARFGEPRFWQIKRCADHRVFRERPFPAFLRSPATPAGDFQKASGNSQTLRALIYGPQGRCLNRRQQVGPGTVRSEKPPLERTSGNSQTLRALIYGPQGRRLNRRQQVGPGTARKRRIDGLQRGISCYLGRYRLQ